MNYYQTQDQKVHYQNLGNSLITGFMWNDFECYLSIYDTYFEWVYDFAYLLNQCIQVDGSEAL